MQTSDRFRMLRSLGLAVAALLLVGGAVFGSQAFNGDSQKDDSNQPGASADVNSDDHGRDASDSPEASESPEASPHEDVNHDVNDDNGSGSPEASASESELENESESESPEASESPDDHGGSSGHGGGDDSNAK